jgi:hypothetical protein
LVIILIRSDRTWMPDVGLGHDLPCVSCWRMHLDLDDTPTSDRLLFVRVGASCHCLQLVMSHVDMAAYQKEARFAPSHRPSFAWWSLILPLPSGPSSDHFCATRFRFLCAKTVQSFSDSLSSFVVAYHTVKLTSHNQHA